MGRHLTFAHNGTVRGLRRKHPLGEYHPIGDTDSEYAFCLILDHLRNKFRTYPRRPRDLWKAVAEIGGRIGRAGTFNFLLGDGTHLFARCSTKLCYIVRRSPFRKATLADDDLSIDFSEVTTPDDRVAIVATTPLTRDEAWTHGEPGNLWVFRGGQLRATLASV